ncbi:TPA: hypothetical protein I8552_004175 [Serratia marcescens]|nr:hypothetical protein [Serratia marcescens]HEJ9029210.1 hypothetical protein [Serratia marcescens]
MKKPRYKLIRARNVTPGSHVWDRLDDAEYLVLEAVRFKTNPKNITLKYRCGDSLSIPLNSYIPVRIG